MTPKNLHDFYSLFKGHDIAKDDGTELDRRAKLRFGDGFHVVDEGNIDDHTRIGINDTFGWSARTSTAVLSGTSPLVIATFTPLTTLDVLTTGSITFTADILEGTSGSFVGHITSGSLLTLYQIRGSLDVTGDQIISGTIFETTRYADQSGRNTEFYITPVSSSMIEITAVADNEDTAAYHTVIRSDETDSFLLNNRRYPRKSIRKLYEPSVLPGTFGHVVQSVDSMSDTVETYTKRSKLRLDASMNARPTNQGLIIGPQGTPVAFITSSLVYMTGTVTGSGPTVDYVRQGAFSWYGSVCVGDPTDILSWNRYDISGYIINPSPGATSSGSIGYQHICGAPTSTTASFFSEIVDNKLKIKYVQLVPSSSQINVWTSAIAISDILSNTTSSLVKKVSYDNTTNNAFTQLSCQIIEHDGRKHAATRIIASSSFNVEDNRDENATVLTFPNYLGLNSGTISTLSVSDLSETFRYGFSQVITDEDMIIGIPIDISIANGTSVAYNKGMLVMKGGVIVSSSFNETSKKPYTVFYEKDEETSGLGITNYRGIDISPDGVNMLSIDSARIVRHHTLTTPGSLADMVLVSTSSIAGVVSIPVGLTWGHDGTYFSVSSGTSTDVLQFNLSSSYGDIDTNTHVATKALDERAHGISYNSDGTILYQIEESGNIWAWSMTPKDVTTAVFSDFKSTPFTDTYGASYINGDIALLGSRDTVAEGNIYFGRFGTTDDLDSLTFNPLDVFHAGTYETDLQGLTAIQNGEKVYFAGFTADEIFRITDTRLPDLTHQITSSVGQLIVNVSGTVDDIVRTYARVLKTQYNINDVSGFIHNDNPDWDLIYWDDFVWG